MGAIASILIVSLFLLVGGSLAVMAVAKKLVYIAGPNEVLVFSGRKSKIGTKVVGYRTIKGGRGFRIPLIETVDRVDLTNMVIDVAVTNAYSKGGIPLKVHGVANVKVAGHEPYLGNAVERFLGKDRRDHQGRQRHSGRKPSRCSVPTHAGAGQ